MEREVLEKVMTPRGELQLQRRGKDYEIIASGVFIMATYNDHSERELARVALASLPSGQEGLAVLIGGLGIGYTLAATLADPRVARVDVVEIEPKISEWNDRYFAACTGHALADSRTELIEGDVVAFLRETERCYDAILLDVDNGPDFLLRAANGCLYHQEGLALIRARLRQGGIAAFWSGQKSERLTADMEAVFGNAREVAVARCDNERLPPDYLYLAGRNG